MDLKFVKSPDPKKVVINDVTELYQGYVTALKTTNSAIDAITETKYQKLFDMATNAAYMTEEEYAIDDNEVIDGYDKYIDNLVTLRNRLSEIVRQYNDYFTIKDVYTTDYVYKQTSLINILDNKEDFFKFTHMTEERYIKAFDAIDSNLVPLLKNFISFHNIELINKNIYNLFEMSKTKYYFTETTDGKFILY